MKGFYYITGLFILAGTVLFLISMPWTLKLCFLGSTLLVLLAILAYGAYRIDSQMFVRTICAGNRSGKLVAISFDDGPHHTRSAGIMEILDRFNCKATFFLTGSKLKGNEDVVKAMVAKGHTVGNHSFSHSNLFPLLGSDQISLEIRETNRLLEDITGESVRYFRPPFGVTNPRIYRGLRGLDMQVTGWSIRSLDTRNEEAEVVVGRIMKKVRGGDIILLHETSEYILNILEQLLPLLSQRELACVNLDQFLAG
ncbi:MAG: polysaccharide deacetylase family protein [Bacteroidota bacterium]